MAGQLQVVRIDELPFDAPMALLERRRVIGEKMMVSDIRLKEGFRVATHSHENEQISIVLSGMLRFIVGPEGGAQQEHVIGAGGAIVLPPNLPHAAEALEDVHVLDLFCPPSAGTGIDRR